MFIDRARITIRSGKGGNGSVSFRREPFVPDGGPDGGDGGKGGNVIFVADSNIRTLLDFRYKRKYEAENGEDGRKKQQYGKAGADSIIKVPAGTLVIDEETGTVMMDLVKDGDRFVAARGGKGGKGNVHFKNSVRQAPNFAEAGGMFQEKQILLELKLIADVGLVGFPNVGKSTLLSVVTGADPKIGNYHFTTLSPNLGVVQYHDSSFVMADIPGLIEGAHEGAGLGLDFLKHVERTRLLIHVVDVSGSESRDPIEDFETINKELSSYSQKLGQKPQLVAANKMDMTDSDDFLRFKDYVESKGYTVFPISAPLHQGVSELIDEAMARLSALPIEEAPVIAYHAVAPEDAPDYGKIECSKDGDVYVLKGKKLDKLFRSTNFNDSGSLRYLYRYVEDSGAIAELKNMGLKDGDTVRIIDFEFEYLDEEMTTDPS
ncbi:MAG: GTPase CgtA [Firmicutes bacterium HGW-Firmicutes-11]|jgi:GTP-binding protein|nr:MAG: GTPase CgtA [Firmicutes bacterium HGW-Firmicutes-11]